MRQKLGTWMLLSVAVTLTAWKCEQGYSEYRAISAAVNSLAVACEASVDNPQVTRFGGVGEVQVCPSVRSTPPTESDRPAKKSAFATLSFALTIVCSRRRIYTHALLWKGSCHYPVISQADVQNRFGQGRIFGSEKAVRLGMADRVSTLTDALTTSAHSGRHDVFASMRHQIKAASQA